MIVNPEFLDPPEIDRTGAAVGAIHGVALVEQQLRQIGAVLTGDTSNNRNTHFSFPFQSLPNKSRV